MYHPQHDVVIASKHLKNSESLHFYWFQPTYNGLIENDPHRSICLNAGPKLVELFGKNWGCVLLEEVCHWGQVLRFQKPTPFQLTLPLLPGCCFNMWAFRYCCSTAPTCLLPCSSEIVNKSSTISYKLLWSWCLLSTIEK